ncbi:hypothetical protein HAX54_044014 [Datura stramonium]|uniref:Uncharacterized protein n=1 Tax=Datura stramonium TaxID=4076 RepID=A0ABS8W1Y0_DATST|nr:hypothetical protein [Datura stramonium]
MEDNSKTEELSVSSQTTTTGNKYGGLTPKKKPLISKDHERAFFDSADWALCKQGAGVDQKSTVAIETLRPKLQRTAYQSNCLLEDLLVHLDSRVGPLPLRNAMLVL